MKTQVTAGSSSGAIPGVEVYVWLECTGSVPGVLRRGVWHSCRVLLCLGDHPVCSSLAPIPWMPGAAPSCDNQNASRQCPVSPDGSRPQVRITGLHGAVLSPTPTWYPPCSPLEDARRGLGWLPAVGAGQAGRGPGILARPPGPQIGVSPVRAECR